MLAGEEENLHESLRVFMGSGAQAESTLWIAAGKYAST